MKPHHLEAKNLAYAYETGREVFTGVNATFRGGEIAGIVGPNGSGKSTLLRVLTGMLPPLRGQVLVDGRSANKVPARERARILAFLPQSVDPVFALTAFEVVCLGRYPHVSPLSGLGSRDLEVAERCLQDTETTHLRDRDFFTLSGGERQRVLIASILAQEPAMLLLDEPTSALDIHHQIEVFTLLERLAGDGYGVAVVTHDLNLAARFCARLLLLGPEAELAAVGAPASVLREPVLTKAYGSRIRVCDHPITHTPLVTAELLDEEGS
ncbi:MAG: ABC transporter ATP-binding protein [Candidatus Hydrogenedentota bacterium]